MIAAVILLLLLTVLVATDHATPPADSSTDEPFPAGAGPQLASTSAGARVQRIWRTLGRLRFHSDKPRLVAPSAGLSGTGAASLPAGMTKEKSGTGTAGACRVRAPRPGARGL